jgi:DNA-directed RNA polymerase specialized sigma24 family protein
MSATARYKANRATLREASEIIGVPVGTLRHAIYRGVVGAGRRRKAHGGQPIYTVDLEEVEVWYEASRTPRRDEAVRLYNDGYQPRAIANMLKIKYASVRRHLNRAGIYIGEPKGEA